uniref:Mediator complex subunit 23 n=1 Tax=Strongyloides venezuelensis TaxID=75913 RepID=A0A0K0FGK0_STRVS
MLQCGEISHIKTLCQQLKAKNDVKMIERTCKASEDDKDKRIEELTQMIYWLSRIAYQKDFSTNVCR